MHYLSVSLSQTLTQSHHTHIFNISLSLSITDTHSHILSLPLSITHTSTHTHTQTHHTHIYCLCLSLSHTHKHTHTHTHYPVLKIRYLKARNAFVIRILNWKMRSIKSAISKDLKNKVVMDSGKGQIRQNLLRNPSIAISSADYLASSNKHTQLN